ncbi:MAG: WD40 repeat domain-containing protein, partial [Verrucomicrobiota bacterium]
VAATGITGLKGEAILWDLKSGKEVRRFGGETHRDILFDAEFSPDGQYLATAGYDRVIRLWSVGSGKFVRSFPSHNGAVYDLAFSPDGKVLGSASGDSTCKIWQVESGDRLDTLNQPQAEQFRIDFSRDGKFILAAGADNRIRVWRFLSREAPRINPVVQSRFGHEDAIVEMAQSRDGKHLVTASADRAVKLWTLPELEPLGLAGMQEDVVAAIEASSSEAFSLARLDGNIVGIGRNDFRLPKVAGSAGETESKKAQVEVAVAPTGENNREKLWLQLGDSVEGEISKSAERDQYYFEAKQGESWVFVTRAQRDKSNLDSHLVVLHESGDPVERVVLQAVRDSWLTFRGKDSKGSGDFRVHNWREMELNEYLYVNGEVVKLWHYPRGPDSGFLVYPGFGNRHGYFETTSLAHPLGQPCYIVRAFSPGSEPSPNGLPLYRLYFENDDESTRMMGSDSKVTFVAPRDGHYRVQVSDVRGFGGKDFHYRLDARALARDFEVTVGGKNAKVSPSSGSEISFTARRLDGFEGAIEIHLSGLPENLSAPRVTVIEEGQLQAFSTLVASNDFKGLSKEESDGIRVVARAVIAGKEVEKDLGGLGLIENGEDAKVLVRIEASEHYGRIAEDGILEFTIAPGETITAKVVADRIGFTERNDVGKDDS